jgi:hypothetical protein
MNVTIRSRSRTPIVPPTWAGGGSATRSPTTSPSSRVGAGSAVTRPTIGPTRIDQPAGPRAARSIATTPSVVGAVLDSASSVAASIGRTSVATKIAPARTLTMTSDTSTTDVITTSWSAAASRAPTSVAMADAHSALGAWPSIQIAHATPRTTR